MGIRSCSRGRLGARKQKNERFFGRQYRYLWQGEAQRWGIGMIDDEQDLVKLMHVCVFEEGIGFIFNEVIYSLCTKCFKYLKMEKDKCKQYLWICLAI